LKISIATPLAVLRVDGELSPWFKTSPGVHQGCVVSRTSHSLTVGDEIFTNLDYADDVSLPACMLEVVVLALEILQEESSQLGLETSWSKTKLQAFDDSISPPSKVSVHVTRLI